MFNFAGGIAPATSFTRCLIICGKETHDEEAVLLSCSHFLWAPRDAVVLVLTKSKNRKQYTLQSSISLWNLNESSTVNSCSSQEQAPSGRRKRMTKASSTELCLQRQLSFQTLKKSVGLPPLCEQIVWHNHYSFLIATVTEEKLHQCNCSQM